MSTPGTGKNVRLAGGLRPPAAPSSGSCTEAPGRHPRTLRLAGVIDATTAETVRERAVRCLRDQPDLLIVDLRAADTCDSTGLRVLRWVLRRATLVGATVRAVPPGEEFCRILKLLGAEDVLAAVTPKGPALAG